MATGDLPFHSDTPVGFLTKHLAEIPVAPRVRRPDLSLPLDALIRKTMEKDAARRYPDAAAMREALLACAGAVTGTPPPGGPPPGRTLAIDISEFEPLGAERMPPLAPTLPPRPAAASSSSSRAPLLIGGVAAAAVIGAVLYFMVGRPAPPATSTTVPIQVATQPPPAPPPPDPTPAPALAVIPTATTTATPAPTASPTPPAPLPPQRPPPAQGPGRKANAADLIKKGDGLRAGGDVDGAIKAYLAAEAADPALPALQKKLAVCYQQQGETAAAKARYQRYLATDPPDAAKVRLILETLQ
jgi:serine/threonine-protein kinase